MEKRSSNHSRSDNLPGISSTHDAVVETQSETAKECLFPPIVAKHGVSKRRRQPNERDERLKDRRKEGFRHDQRTMSVIDGEVPNREIMGQRLERSDTALVSTSQQIEYVPYPRTSSDTMRTRNEKMALERRSCLVSCPASENVIIEEVYLLPRSKSTVSMTHRSRRQEICRHPALRATRSDESSGLRGIRHCGDILSRRVYYNVSETGFSSSLFGKEEICEKVAMTDKARAAHLRNLPVQQKEYQQKTTEYEQFGATAKQHVLSQLHQENTTESTTEASNQDDSTAFHTSPSLMIFHGEAVIAKHLVMARDKEKNYSACHVTDESEERQEQRKRRHGVCEAKYEARVKEEENSEGQTTKESKERQRQQMQCHGVCEAKYESRDKDEEQSLGHTTDEFDERQGEQIRSQGGCGAKEEATDEERENPPRACLTTELESEERQDQQMRRQGVCQAVDETAARRRRARVLKKRLFGDDLPNDDELMIQRALNKRM